MLSFESTAFAVVEGEDTETNPGIFGKALAEWLSARLNERGVKANPPFAEDWGWCVEFDAAGTGAADAMGETFEQLDELLVTLGASVGRS
jgi:hypothetical protein